ncbi:hypothetical protein BJ322DRAFT_640241 [Thelephora terrestris]|uniref:Secreted protein n=1 Tax=Thelephora terrestris TaxID=56493 RepID=A0A9P6HLC4_9AGAM|nr:hypothetical protein BJ322DRAFT_640241 [Thelephora terrestris]
MWAKDMVAAVLFVLYTTDGTVPPFTVTVPLSVLVRTPHVTRTAPARASRNLTRGVAWFSNPRITPLKDTKVHRRACATLDFLRERCGTWPSSSLREMRLTVVFPYSTVRV